MKNEERRDISDEKEQEKKNVEQEVQNAEVLKRCFRMKICINRQNCVAEM